MSFLLNLTLEVDREPAETKPEAVERTLRILRNGGLKVFNYDPNVEDENDTDVRTDR